MQINIMKMKMKAGGFIESVYFFNAICLPCYNWHKVDFRFYGETTDSRSIDRAVEKIDEANPLDVCQMD